MRPSQDRPTRPAPTPAPVTYDSDELTIRSTLSDSKGYFINLTDVSGSESEDNAGAREGRDGESKGKDKSKKKGKKSKRDKSARKSKYKGVKAVVLHDSDDQSALRSHVSAGGASFTGKTTVTLSDSSSSLDVTDDDEPGFFARMMKSRARNKRKLEKKEEKRLLKEKALRKQERARIRALREKQKRLNPTESPESSDVSSDVSEELGFFARMTQPRSRLSCGD